jgi:hypothetical protein
MKASEVCHAQDGVTAWLLRIHDSGSSDHATSGAGERLGERALYAGHQIPSFKDFG